MRYALIAAALALAGCGVNTEQGRDAASPAPGYTLEVFAHENEQIYLVAHDDGRTAAARAAEGTSAIIPAEEAQSLLAERQAAFTAPGEDEAVSLRAGKFRLSIGGEDLEGENSDRVSISMDTGNGGFSLDAQGDGASDGRARVRITGANEETARNFVDEAEGLSAEVKAEMLQSLGL